MLEAKTSKITNLLIRKNISKSFIAKSLSDLTNRDPRTLFFHEWKTEKCKYINNIFSKFFDWKLFTMMSFGTEKKDTNQNYIMIFIRIRC